MTYQRILNIIWFQSIFMLSLRYQHEYIWVSSILFLLHLIVVRDKNAESRTLALGLTTGLIVDVSYTLTGVFVFSHSYPLTIPIWLLFIWCAFACCLTRSLKMFQHRYLLGGLAAGIAGPFCYWNGHRLGAVDFPLGTLETLIMLGVSWAIVFPLMNCVNNRLISDFSSAKHLQSKSYSHYN